MTHRILLVEQSATMRYVIEKHAESLGFTVDGCDSYQQAGESLAGQFQQFGAEYSGVLFGWPTTSQDDATEFARQLDSSDHKDLAVVVMSTDMRAETRAWVADRANTAILAWKEYQGLESLLKKLIDLDKGADSDSDTLPLKADNNDIHLLVVDDSATIRYSLRDLFQMHGYQITLAATRDEAIEYARNVTFDIAVLDYYLTETTGDVLCRELLASTETGDIVCTVLTGTYSDHIIKRSLRAGAVECMFKNESSELLLSRIDAISRFVRQKRQLQVEQQLLEDVLECIAGSLILINDEQRIVYINTSALEQLGLDSRDELMGQLCEQLLEKAGPAEPGSQVHAATWNLPDGETVDVDYQHSRIENSGYSLLRFAHRSVPIAHAGLAVLQQSNDPQSMVDTAVRQFMLPENSTPFLHQIIDYLDSEKQRELSGAGVAQPGEMRISLLALDVFLRSDGGQRVALSDQTAVASTVSDTLLGMLTREHHVVSLGGNRFAFLLRHAEESQAYVLTRKVMQRCLEVTRGDEFDEQLACTASLLSLSKNSSQPLNVLLQHVFKGLDLVNRREPDQAILLDVRRMLSAYPTNAT